MRSAVIDRGRRRPSARGRFPAALLCLFLCSARVSAQAIECDFVPELLQVRLVNGASVDSINLAYGTITEDSLPPQYLLRVPQGSTVEQILELLKLEPLVVDAEPAYTNETPEGTRQMVVAAVGGTIEDFQDQDFVNRIHLPEIQQHTLGEGILVAVLDTGILLEHEAISAHVSSDGFDFIGEDADPSEEANGVDDDGDGQTDEGAGHGTMVGGICLLVAPGCEILPVRILDDEGRGTTFNVAKAIRYAVDQGADAINLSLGLSCVSKIIGYEIERADSAGVSLTAAAGNDNAEFPALYPASDPRVLSITSLDSADVKADFANYDESVDLSAPGVGVLGPYIDGEYALGAGTSFSSPMVAGQVALIRALDPSLTKTEIDSLSRLGTVDIYDILENLPYLGKLGTGRLDGLETLENTPASAYVAEPAPALARRVYPNPATAGSFVTMEFSPRESAAGGSLEIYDVRGRRVRSLDAPSTSPFLIWDGRDGAGRASPGGVYFAKPSWRPLGKSFLIVLY